jgi:hypothetical protein
VAQPNDLTAVSALSGRQARPGDAAVFLTDPAYLPAVLPRDFRNAQPVLTARTPAQNGTFLPILVPDAATPSLMLRHARVWLVDTARPTPGGAVPATLHAHYRRTEAVTITGITVSLWPRIG